MDFKHGTSRHKILHIIAKNGGSIPSANSAYNLTRGIKSDLGRATLAQDRTMFVQRGDQYYIAMTCGVPCLIYPRDRL